MRVTEVQVKRVVEVLSGVEVRRASRVVDEDGVIRWQLVYRTDEAEGQGVIDEALVSTVLNTMLDSLAAPAARPALIAA